MMFSLILEFCFKEGARGPFSPARLIYHDQYFREFCILIFDKNWIVEIIFT